MAPGCVCVSAALATSKCTGDVDCNYAGHCQDDGTCVCDPPFTGAACDGFELFSYATSDGGFQISTGNTSWGGSVVRVPKVDEVTNTTTYSYHMYAAMMKNNGTLSTWLSESVVAHAVSTSGRPEGP